MMPHKTGSEVRRDTCALTLGDEPLAGRVEHGATQLPVLGPEVAIVLHELVHGQPWEQPARGWQGGIQEGFQQPMQGRLPPCCLGLEQSERIGPDADEAPQVSLGRDCQTSAPVGQS